MTIMSDGQLNLIYPITETCIMVANSSFGLAVIACSHTIWGRKVQNLVAKGMQIDVIE